MSVELLRPPYLRFPAPRWARGFDVCESRSRGALSRRGDVALKRWITATLSPPYLGGKTQGQRVYQSSRGGDVKQLREATSHSHAIRTTYYPYASYRMYAERRTVLSDVLSEIHHACHPCTFVARRSTSGDSCELRFHVHPVLRRAMASDTHHIGRSVYLHPASRHGAPDIVK
jgi:hypothetical protein